MTETSASTERFDERLLALEQIHSEVGRRQRVTVIALMPLAAAMAMIIPYMQIVLTLQDADYYYVLARPDWPIYFRLVGAALFAGPLSVVLIFLVFKQLDDLLPTFIKMMVFGLWFGILMPFITGILTPLNLFVIGVTGVSNVSGQGSVQQMLGDWVFSTPLFTFLFWADWVGPGIFFGLIAGLFMWLIAKFAGPIEQRGRAKFIYIGSSLTAVAVLFLVTVWPYWLFEYMFETFL